MNFILHTYMVQMSSQNSAGKKVFYGGFLGPPPPPAQTKVKVPWSLKLHLGVKCC